MSTRLTTSEIKYFSERLSEIAELSKKKTAVVMKLRPGGEERPVLFFRNGMIWRKYRRPVPLKDITGWEAFYVISKKWEPLDPRHPLELLAETAKDESDSDQKDDSAWF